MTPHPGAEKCGSCHRRHRSQPGRARGSTRRMLMFESPLNRYAGPIALIAGGLFAVIHGVQLLVADRSDLAAMVTDPVFMVVSAAYFIAFPLLLIALVALY